MRESKPHGFVAWLFDLYVASFIAGGVVAGALAIADKTGDMRMAITTLGTAVVISAAYHLVLARRNAWLSPGEKIAGRFIDTSGKTWRNPYRRTRWPLFAVMLLVTILAGNSWDGIGRGAVLSIDTVALDAIALAVLVVGLVAAGQGNAWGMVAPAAYCALLAATAIRTTVAGVPASVLVTSAVFSGLCSVLCLLVGGSYVVLREPNAA